MGVGDLSRPDVRPLVDATHGGGNQHILLTMKPARPSLSGAMRIVDGRKIPVGAKFDGGKVHRRVLAHEGKHGLLSAMGPNGLFYGNTVGAIGVVSAWRNWDRLASAPHRWSLK